MKLRILSTTTLLFISIGLVANPSLSQTNLNTELSQAVCNQEWRRAMLIVDRMRAIAPQSAGELLLYRSQLQALQDSGARFTKLPAYCSSNSPPAVTNVPNPPPLPQTIQGVASVTEINAPYRTRRVSGKVTNNTNNPITAVKVKFKIVRTQNPDGEPIPEEITETGSAVVSPDIIQPGAQGVFEADVNSRIRGDAKVVAVEWQNTLDGSAGANPQKQN